MSTYRPRRRRSKLFWKDLTIVIVALIIILFAIAMAGVLRKIRAQEPASADVVNCKVTKVANMIHVECAGVIRTMPKRHWPKAWQYADGEHPANLPPRIQEQPREGQMVKAIWIDNEFIPIEPCEVRTNLRVRAWTNRNPGVLPSSTIYEPPGDCQKIPRALDFYEVQDILRRRQQEEQP